MGQLVNYMCQLDWATSIDIWASISACLSGCFSEWDHHLNWWTEYSQLPSFMRVALIQSLEDMGRVRKARN